MMIFAGYTIAGVIVYLLSCLYVVKKSIQFIPLYMHSLWQLLDLTLLIFF